MEKSVRNSSYFGLFFVALSTLMYETLLTRIFSVTAFYHFAFMAISIAMFGMTVGALIVLMKPQYFKPEVLQRRLFLSALGFSLSMVFCFLAHLCIPFIFRFTILGIFSMSLIYTLISIPFVFSGVCITLMLTRVPGNIGKIYAADLAGAGLGCLAFIYVLRITDGATAVVFAACIASLGAIFFTTGFVEKKLTYLAYFCFVGLLAFTIGNTCLANHQKSLLTLPWVKGVAERKPMYEKWNEHSRITVQRNADTYTYSYPTPFEELQTSPNDKSLTLGIDANAATNINKFDGNLASLDPEMRNGLTALPHWLRKNAQVLIIGPGGGTDVLIALAFNQAQIIAVEINKLILDALNGVYGEYSGHLDKQPTVRFVHDEARSYIMRGRELYDIILATYVDTWAATGAGAFVLTEHSLYTMEAWTSFLRHLNPHGVLVFSRAWHPADHPREVYRITSLAAASLKKLGVSDPENHIMLVGHFSKPGAGLVSILVSPNPFSVEDEEIVKRHSEVAHSKILVSPHIKDHAILATLASGEDPGEIMSDVKLNLTPPTDNKPFFFFTTRFRDIIRLRRLAGHTPVVVLAVLLVTVVILTALFIFSPLIFFRKDLATAAALPPSLLLFFFSIGFGFMLVEIAQMQRLAIFLGHPSYSLSATLFGILIASSIGSFFSRNVNAGKMNSALLVCWSFLLLVLALFGFATPVLAARFQDADTGVRIAWALFSVVPIGFFMGMPFPYGMKIATQYFSNATPWFWGINGAASVCASVVAVVISIGFGISTTYFIGVFFYIVAFLSFIATLRLLKKSAVSVR